MKKLIYTFATITEAKIRKAFQAVSEHVNRFTTAFNIHWPRHHLNGDDEGVVESLATEGSEGQMLRAAGSRALKMSNRILVDDGSDSITDLLGNADDEAAIHKDGIHIARRDSDKVERGYTEPLLNCDFADDNSGVPRYWTAVIGDAGVSGEQSDTELFKGAQSWKIYSPSPPM